MLIKAAAQRDSYVLKAIKGFEHFSPELLSSLCDCGKLLSEHRTLKAKALRILQSN